MFTPTTLNGFKINLNVRFSLMSCSKFSPFDQYRVACRLDKLRSMVKKIKFAGANVEPKV